MFPFSYLTGFLLLALATDAAIVLMLWHRGSRVPGSGRDSHASARRGAACWILGVALLGPVSLTRFDMAAAAFTVAAMLTTSLAGSALLGAGAGVKLWPGLLAVLPGHRVGRERPAARAVALVVGTVLVTAPMLVLDAATAVSALAHQASRGLQVESLAATPFVLAHMVGLAPAADYSYGSFQISGALAAALALAAICIGAGAVCLVVRDAWLPEAPRFVLRRLPAAWARSRADSRHPGPPLATSATALLLCMLATYRVLSPQYLLWPLATVCVAVARREAGSRRTAGLLLGAAALTQIVYPWRYNDLIQGRSGASLLLLSRNGLLVAAAISAVVAVRGVARESATRSLRVRTVEAMRPRVAVAASAMAPPVGSSADSGRTVGRDARSRKPDMAPSHRREPAPAAASTAIAGVRYQG
jgi:hypothetical protein